MAIAVEKIQSPNHAEALLSQASGQVLAEAFLPDQESCLLQVINGNDSGPIVEIPSSALQLLIEILNQMAQGNTFAVIPMQTELSTQEAADILGVSRPFVVKLLETGAIPFVKVGTHRRIRIQDLLTYKREVSARQQRAMDELVAEAQALKMGY